jgi:hypothetical protein
MTVGIFSGREGVGKTTQLLSLAKSFPKAVWVVLELKDMRNIMKEENDDFKMFKAYTTDKKRRVDPIATLNAVAEARDYVLSSKQKTVVIDGISDLRDYATTAWANEYNEAHDSHLTTPKYKDWGEWGVINEKVRDILEPLINDALERDYDLWMTAQMKDDYVNDVKIGSKPDIKEWMSYPVQCLFELRYEKGEYSMECTKEPVNAAWEIPALKKNIGVLKALMEHGLVDRTESVLEQVAEQKEFMIRYGDNKKMFLSASSKEKAIKKFIKETDGKIEKYEVLE